MRILACLLMCLPWLSHAEDRVQRSFYPGFDGDRFFLLSDRSFGPDDEARVRLEIPGDGIAEYNIQQYGGVDIRLYAVDQPLEFLRKQKNLHRIAAIGDYRGEGLANTLAYLWDSAYKTSRRVMQRVFSYEVRREVTAEQPQLQMGDATGAPTPYEATPQYAPLPGFTLLQTFRYPVFDAKPLGVPEGVKLQGSSSEFIAPRAGNVHVPLGKLAPGLYLVEGLAGQYRAITVVFVSNTTAITKLSARALTVWTVNRTTQAPVHDAEVLWTDGIGVMKQGRTDDRGLLTLEHASPERSYVLGQDPDGGVFVSENFYYDSEIYTTQLYAFTDRPLYRAGDWVHVKVMAREFIDAQRSRRAVAAPLEIGIVDANGSMIESLSLQLDPQTGADTRFQLPLNATAGGYELRMLYRDQIYSSAFRVSEYVKPHFEITMTLDTPEPRTGHPVTGSLKLLYPDGSPVADAKVELNLRSQQLSVVDNEVRYLGLFPVELETQTLQSDAQGRVMLNLPPATQPSRYILTVMASDGMAYRVKSTQEILVERGVTHYRLEAPRTFSAVGEDVTFSLTARETTAAEPAGWRWVRLEDQTSGSGDIDGSAFSIRFERPGTYTVTVEDQAQQTVATRSHHVSGAGITAIPGTVDIVLDQATYQNGDTVSALITFPEPVSEALITLERDRVEAVTLLSAPDGWLRLEKLSETQYRARIPVDERLAPNITLSVLYARGDEFSFQNAGIVIPAPRIRIDIATDKPVYAPGERVTVTLTTQLRDRPVSADVAVAVVDELIHVLQPELAPRIDDFFHHIRRNNVRTGSSTTFISYDLAAPGTATPPGRYNRSDRRIKLLERPRRDTVDTAAWEPRLTTDASGRVQFSFVMPDSLTRWRITARAMHESGHVGQHSQTLLSDKPLYLKWTGPTHFREGDAPLLNVVVFNRTNTPRDAVLHLTGALTEERPLTLMPGVSSIALPATAETKGALTLTLLENATPVDQLEVPLHRMARGWEMTQSLRRVLTGVTTPLELPKDAHNIRVRLDSSPHALFMTVMDDLLDYPWGCVEQTASRLIPLSLAYAALPADSPVAASLRQSLRTSRLRLTQMAGENATFAWWGPSAGAEDALMTAYAYYADWHASQPLGLTLPPEHWQRVMDIYSQQAKTLPPLHQALILMFAQEMGMPVKTLLEGVIAELPDAEPFSAEATEGASLILTAPDSASGLAAAHVITQHVAQRAGLTVPAPFVDATRLAREHLHGHEDAFVRVMLSLDTPLSPQASVALLQSMTPESPTLERAIALNWLRHALTDHTAKTATLRGDWSVDSAAGETNRLRWNRPGQPDALTLDAEPTTPLTALVSVESAASVGDTLPLTLTRRLYRLSPGRDDTQWAASPIDVDHVVSDVLYLDEVTLTPLSQSPLRHALLEIPLPPGADVEPSTWGLSVTGLQGESALGLEKPRHEPGVAAYAVPVDGVSGPVVVRHLVRFSQRGTFHVPPVRLSLMYDGTRQQREAQTLLETVTVK